METKDLWLKKIKAEKLDEGNVKVDLTEMDRMVSEVYQIVQKNFEDTANIK